MENKTTISEQIGKFVCDFQFSDIPDDIVTLLEDLLMDTVGCILAGHIEPSNAILVKTLKEKGGKPESTVFGYGFRTDAATCAMINGCVGHTVELDDDHREGTLHTGVVVFPTVLALGEKLGATGKEVLTAALMGYEIGIRIGKAFLGDLFYQGFHPTGVCGVFASCVAAGKLLGLTPTQLANAIGIAGSQASGNREWKTTGAWTKRLQAGHANFSGVTAAMLAKNGFTGPLTALEGEYGLFKSYSYQGHYDLEGILSELGSHWEIRNDSLKPHASCRFTQPIVDSTLAIVKKFDLKPEDIKAVHVGTGKNALISLTVPSERKYHPVTRVDAQFSLPYASAVAIHRRKAFIEEFNPSSFTDDEILKTAQKIDYYLDPVSESKWPVCYAAKVTVETVDERVLEDRTDYPKGDPENPMSKEEVIEKYLTLASYTVDESTAGKSAEMMSKLRSMEKIEELCLLLKGDE